MLELADDTIELDTEELALDAIELSMDELAIDEPELEVGTDDGVDDRAVDDAALLLDAVS